MHFANGREAKNGDPVVVKDGDTYRAGTLHSITSQTESCNAQVAYAIPGGCYNACITLKDAFHAEDAFNAGKQLLSGS